MNLSGPGVTYILLVIPIVFALAVLGQGLFKISREERDGGLVLTFGIIFLLIIIASYFFFIR